MGLFDTLGQIMQTAGMVTNLAGLPMVGAPIAAAGSGISGGSKGGVGGAVKGIGSSLVGSGLAMGAGGLIDSLKMPSDAGAMTAFSKAGAPLTVPGIRPEPISNLFSSTGGAMTIPASPQTIGGS